MNDRNKYGSVALERQLHELAATGAGGRNSATFTAALKMGSIIAAGALDEESTYERLVKAAVATGLGQSEARAAVRSGFAKGKLNPKSIGDVRGDSASVQTWQAPPPPRRPLLTYPPESYVQKLWARCVEVSRDDDARVWIETRALDAGAIDDGELSRVLPANGDLPSWARMGRKDWRDSRHRLILPLHDRSGRVRSLKARSFDLRADRKSLNPRGFSPRGLVLADRVGREMLEIGNAPAWWPKGEPFVIVIAEGGPDFLTFATRHGDACEARPATFGIFSGSWTVGVAARVPDDSTVVVATHADVKGEKFAANIVASLAGRCSLRRWSSKGVRRDA